MTGSNGSGQTQQKPVTIDYASGCDHAVSFTWLINYPVQPLFYGKWAIATVSATGEVDGKVVTGSEEFRKFFPAVGLALNIWPETPNISRVAPNIWFAAGDRYSKVEGTLSAPLWSDIGLRIGGFYEHMDMGELRVRNTGFLLGGVIQW